jgi:hypothetical protein
VVGSDVPVINTELKYKRFQNSLERGLENITAFIDFLRSPRATSSTSIYEYVVGRDISGSINDCLLAVNEAWKPFDVNGQGFTADIDSYIKNIKKIYSDFLDRMGRGQRPNNSNRRGYFLDFQVDPVFESVSQEQKGYSRIYQVLESFLEHFNNSFARTADNELRHWPQTVQQTFEALALSLESNLNHHLNPSGVPTIVEPVDEDDVFGGPSIANEGLCTNCRSPGGRNMCCWLKTRRTSGLLDPVQHSPGKKRSYETYSLSSPPPLPPLPHNDRSSVGSSSSPSTPKSSKSSTPNAVQSPMPSRKREGNCITCGVEGHWSYECPEGNACYSCGRHGHFARVCPDSPSKRGNCSNCGGRDHGTATCNRTTPRSLNLPVIEMSPLFKQRHGCHACGEIGHWAARCPKRGSSRGPVRHDHDEGIDIHDAEGDDDSFEDMHEEFQEQYDQYDEYDEYEDEEY